MYIYRGSEQKLDLMVPRAPDVEGTLPGSIDGLLHSAHQKIIAQHSPGTNLNCNEVRVIARCSPCLH